MKNQGKVILIACVLSTGTAYSAIPNNYEPKTYLGNILHLGFADLINETYHYSLALEGVKNQQRYAAAGGYQADKYQRFKVYAEYLRQNIGYSYFSGNSYQWDYQTAVNFRYQYRYLDMAVKPTIELAGYMTHAPSLTLSNKIGTYIPNSTGVVTPFKNTRRLAGSTTTGLVSDFAFELFRGNSTGFGVNYDNVRYNTEIGPDQNPGGLGGNLFLRQQFKNMYEVGATAAFRQPFNNYEFNAGLNNIKYHGNWSVGVEGDYLRGKVTLPSTYNFGLYINYSPELCNIKTAEMCHEKQNLLAWIAKPAVKIPQIMAIADEVVS